MPQHLVMTFIPSPHCGRWLKLVQHLANLMVHKEAAPMSPPDPMEEDARIEIFLFRTIHNKHHAPRHERGFLLQRGML